MIGKAVPDNFLKMERAVGVDAMRKFLHARAGRVLKVPARDPSETDHPEVIAWLQKHVGTGNVDIPLGPLRQQTRLTWAIYLGLKAGLSLGQIAVKCRCTTRTVSSTKSRLQKKGLSLAPQNPKPTQDAKP